jgi:hypothetical protein
MVMISLALFISKVRGRFWVRVRVRVRVRIMDDISSPNLNPNPNSNPNPYFNIIRNPNHNPNPDSNPFHTKGFECQTPRLHRRYNICGQVRARIKIVISFRNGKSTTDPNPNPKPNP